LKVENSYYRIELIPGFLGSF